MIPNAETRKPVPKMVPPVTMAFLVPTFIVHLPNAAAERPPKAICTENKRWVN